MLHRKPDPAGQCFLSIDALRLLDDIAKQALVVAQPEGRFANTTQKKVLSSGVFREAQSA